MTTAVEDSDKYAAASAVVDAARSVQEAVEAIRDIYGLDHATYHHQPIGGSGPEAPYVKSTYPAEWLTRYLLNGYIRVDPVVLAGFSRMLPFDWQDVEWTQNAKAFMLDAFAHGLGGNGYSVPLIDKRTRRALFSVNSQMPQPAWQDFIAANAAQFAELGQRMHRRVIEELYASADPLPQLKPREIEVLAWAAQGLEAKEIARKMGISVHTAQDYQKSARSKLRCETMAHAVAEAIRLGIIMP